MVVLAASGLLAGCTTLGYYWQSIDGQWEMLRVRQPISSVLADPSTPPELRSKLARVLEIREFASRELKLPDNMSYRGYADVRRDFVVWNVFATDEFSIVPRQWCFPIAGCVGYRGYFAKAAAEKFAHEQRSLGLDAYVGGVPAYSTLGWFDDPVLNTVIRYPDYELARLIFHELAHQVAYAKNDSEFNESFAVAVEVEGMRRWAAVHGDARMRAAFEQAQTRRAQFTALVLKYRGELDVLYRSSGLAADAMRKRKAALLAAMVEDYQWLKKEWGGYAGYDPFFAGVNNAGLASIAIYHSLVPRFQQLLAQRKGDLVQFYEDVKRLAVLGKDERLKALVDKREMD